MTPTMEHFLPQRKKGFSALYVFDVGGDEIRIEILLQTLTKYFIVNNNQINKGFIAS